MRNTLKFLIGTMCCAMIFGNCGYSMHNHNIPNNKHVVNKNNMQKAYDALKINYQSLGNIIQPSSAQFLGKNQDYKIYNAFKQKFLLNSINKLINDLISNTVDFIQNFKNIIIPTDAHELFSLAWGILLKYAEDNKLHNETQIITKFIEQECLAYNIFCSNIIDPIPNINIQNNNNANQINFINDNNHNINNINENDDIKTTKDEKYIKDYLTKPDTIRSGLNNVGATCYMNATLQCLANNPNLSAKIIKYNRTKQLNGNNKTLSKQYAEVLENILFNKVLNSTPYDPSAFNQTISQMNPLFAKNQANDSKDLVLFLLETMHAELNKCNNLVDYPNNINQYDYRNVIGAFSYYFTNNFKSIISGEFYGMYNSMMQCQKCNFVTHSAQCYNILIFPLEEVRLYKNKTNNTVTLYDCFDHYQKLEYMFGQNQIYCNHCKQMADAINQNKLVTAPNTLIINLNRGKGIQYNVNIALSEDIVDLSKYFHEENNVQYYLSGVVCHFGPSGDSGHFIAYTRNSPSRNWYCFNDGSVTQADEIKGLPYILFYTKINSENYNHVNNNVKMTIDTNQPMQYDAGPFNFHM